MTTTHDPAAGPTRPTTPRHRPAPGPLLRLLVEVGRHPGPWALLFAPPAILSERIGVHAGASDRWTVRRRRGRPATRGR